MAVAVACAGSLDAGGVGVRAFLRVRAVRFKRTRCGPYYPKKSSQRCHVHVPSAARTNGETNQRSIAQIQEAPARQNGEICGAATQFYRSTAYSSEKVADSPRYVNIAVAHRSYSDALKNEFGLTQQELALIGTVAMVGANFGSHIGAVGLPKPMATGTPTPE